MKPIRWSSHALKNLADREIPRAEAEKTLASPEIVVPGAPQAPERVVGAVILRSRRRRRISYVHENAQGEILRFAQNDRMEATGDYGLHHIKNQQIYKGNNAMRVTYDQETDTMTIALRDARIRESDEVRPGVIADFGYDGGIVRFEILDASKVVQNAREIQFAVGE